MIYADYNGSAPLCKEVTDYLIERLKSGPFANPNAIHHMGQKCKMGMENARAVCAKNVGALPKNIIFNSGSTEGISQVFFSLLHGQREATGKDQIFISGIEHSAVIKCARFYEQDEGYKVQIIPTLPNGQCDIESLKTLLSEYAGKVAMVSVMAANNETGVIQPYKEIGAACAHSQTPFVCDTTQYIGKAPFNFKESNIDFAFAAGHKIGAMTGAGFVLAKDTNLLKPHIIGGGQEKDLRGGTQNYIGFEAIAVAMNTFSEKQEKLKKLEASRNNFEASIRKEYPELVIMGEDAPRLGGTSFISLPGIHGQAVQIELESNDIYVTTSSACSDNEPTTSKVLKAMGVTDDVGRGAVRISLGTCSPEDGHEKILKSLLSAYKKLSKIGSY